ncbi:MAG: sulfite exporter TauE/SafE family protein [Oscillatoriaceae cyanobacterium Prado104]|jgi:uncharacterized membrane protein YfcA|nr:sulfite exporter TauE/SafE family protein [Oscillatoriaceae cyanobacterium Prado104]
MHKQDSKFRLNFNYLSLLAFLFAIPIGLLGGLIGLGGAEFRLPVIAGILNYPVRQAVPINLAVSLITIAASLAIRSSTVSFAPAVHFLPAILATIAGAIVTAFFGPALSGKLSNEQLERVVLVLLVTIGMALIVEGFLPQQLPALIPASVSLWILSGILFGLAIGLVSSLLGVAGGEIIIPTFLFAYGADIKTAGTISLLISLPTVIVGVLKYQSLGGFSDRAAISRTIAPMGIGSIIGAIVGGLSIGLISPAILKILLGIILNVSAFKVFHKTRFQVKRDK